MLSPETANRHDLHETFNEFALAIDRDYSFANGLVDGVETTRTFWQRGLVAHTLLGFSALRHRDDAGEVNDVGYSFEEKHTRRIDALPPDAAESPEQVKAIANSGMSLWVAQRKMFLFNFANGSITKQTDEIYTLGNTELTTFMVISGTPIYDSESLDIEADTVTNVVPNRFGINLIEVVLSTDAKVAPIDADPFDLIAEGIDDSTDEVADTIAHMVGITELLR